MTCQKLLLLDEPSSGLDRNETAALAETLRRVQEERGFAILLVEHDIELVSSFTTRSYLLDFGRLLLSGSTAEVMASDEMRHAYLGEVSACAPRCSRCAASPRTTRCSGRFSTFSSRSIRKSVGVGTSVA